MLINCLGVVQDPRRVPCRAAIVAQIPCVAWQFTRGYTRKALIQGLFRGNRATLTLDRYGHLFPDDLDAVADTFDSAADALRTLTGLRVVGSDEISP